MNLVRTQTGIPPRLDGRRPAFVIAAIACALAVCACGSSTPSHSASKGATQNRIAFSDCMRSHGVPGFPDPSAGGGIQIPSGSGINPFSPSFKAAQASCAKLMPGGGPGAHHASAQERAQLVATAECMRRHGVSGFPDPTTVAPSSPAGYSELENLGGIIIAIPDTINMDSPVFKQAAAACKFS